MRSFRRVIAAAIAAVAVIPIVSVGPAFALPPGCTEASGTVTCSYSSTGDEQQFKVPAGVSSVDVTAIGGKGGAGAQSGTFAGTPGAGGFGAAASGTLSVTPGDTLFVEVGGNGGSNFAGGTGGFNGGGNGPTYSGDAGGGGGGASDVRTVSCGSPCDTLDSISLSSRLLVAAGGGGGGAAFNDNGGAGGTAGSAPSAGADGTDTAGGADSGGHGGGAGSNSQGGTGGAAGTCDTGITFEDGTDGSAGQGGSGQVNAFTQEPGGGGGGGYYGGGGGGSGARCTTGQVGGGGGGGAGSSSVVASATNPSVSTDATGVPSITIEYELFSQADGWIRRGVQPYVGKNVYNSDASGQTQIAHPVEGAKVLFRIAIQNDGNRRDRFNVHATGQKVSGFRIRYFHGSTEITDAVVDGTFTTPRLRVGARYTIDAWVKVKLGAGNRTSRLVTLTAMGDATSIDAVKFVVEPR